MTSSALEVLGIAAPLVDNILEVSESFVKTVSARKGGMQEVDYETMQELIVQSGSPVKRVPGGSGANTIKGLAALGHTCGVIGKVCQDDAGRFFLENLQNQRIKSLYLETPTHTSQTACFITPDRQRTFRSFHGACVEMSAEALNPSDFKGVKLVHVEGYSLMNGDLPRRAMELAKEAEAKVSFDLASFELTRQYKDTINHLLTHYVDIVFANEDETYTLTGCTPEEGCSILKELAGIAVVLMGREGCWVGSGEKVVHCPAYPVDAVDTVGAGDLFAAGFLHGILTGRPVEECAHYGAITGRAVVQVVGAEIPQAQWLLIKTSLKK